MKNPGEELPHSKTDNYLSSVLLGVQIQVKKKCRFGEFNSRHSARD
jgi:hypothetical protein